MDMRAQDRAWLKLKLDSLAKTPGAPFTVAMPPDGLPVPVTGNVSAFAKVVEYRCEALGVFDGEEGETPLVDAMFSRKEPKSGVDGTLSWTVDILNPATGDDFAMFVKECVLPDGSKRPFSVWLSGAYPLEFNGLTKSLSLDMRVIDPAWIGKKLRGLKDLPEAQGDFFARQPGSEKQAVQPSTLAYVARLLIHRYEMLGVLDAAGYPTAGSAMLWSDAPAPGTGPVQVTRADLPGMRAPDADPAGRLRLLHLVRACGGLRLIVPPPGAGDCKPGVPLRGNGYGVLLDAHVMHNACTGHMRPCARDPKVNEKPGRVGETISSGGGRSRRLRRLRGPGRG